MKGVVGLAVLVGVGAGGWWAFKGVVTHDTHAIPIAFGFPDDRTIEMQAIASMGMTVTEGPKADPKTGKPKWEEWVEEHFELRDAGGARVKLSLVSHSDLIPKHKVLGTPEGYLVGRLEKGTSYTFDYIPKRAEAKRYRHAFTAPAADKEVERVAFETK